MNHFRVWDFGETALQWEERLSRNFTFPPEHSRNWHCQERFYSTQREAEPAVPSVRPLLLEEHVFFCKALRTALGREERSCVTATSSQISTAITYHRLARDTEAASVVPLPELDHISPLPRTTCVRQFANGWFSRKWTPQNAPYGTMTNGSPWDEPPTYKMRGTGLLANRARGWIVLCKGT